MDIERLRTGLGHHYLLERELGRGGMATVYLATDVRLGRKVAVKVLHPDLAAAVGAERFKREIEIVTRLTHPNILAIYDSGEADGLLYYVMPLVEGESLRDLLQKQRQLSIEDAVRLAVQVANALDYAHRHGVVHRDIKPENILLEDGQAIVADFGVARAVSAAADGARLTQTGMAIGTPQYMSPEQALAERDLDGRSDQYALGCVVYEMLAGQPPFTGPSMQSLVMAHAVAPVPSLRIARQTVSEELEAVIMRALAKSPADRFATLKEFAQALVAPTNVTWAWRTPSTGMFSVPGAQQRAARRRWMLVAASLLVFATGAGAFAWHSVQSGRAMDATLAAGGLEPQRVAVTYFDDGSADGSLAYLADGLTESLIDVLDRVDVLDVVSRSGVSPFRAESVASDSIARALDVGTLVRGSVAPEGDKVRVTVRLVDGASGADVDRRTFTAPAAAALAIRDSLAQEVSDFLRERLGREVRLRRERSGTTSDAAWVLVRRAERERRAGEELADHGDRPGADRHFAQADALLAEAQRTDGAWVEPLVQRAWVAYRRSRAAADAHDKVRWADAAIAIADSALARSPGESSALEVRGTARYFLYLAHLIPDPRESRRAFESAEQDIVAATQRDPGNASAWTTLSHLLTVKPDFAGAKLAALNAYQRDAFLVRAADVVNRLYQTSYLTETFNDADHWCSEGRRRFADDPRFLRCRLWLLTVPKVAPRALPDSAWRLVAAFDSLLPKGGGELSRREARVAAAIVIARAGMADSAARVLATVRTTSSDVDPNSDLLFMEAYARLTMGDKETALQLLGDYVARNPEHRDGWRKDSAWWWRELERDPRFERLMGGAGSG